jgi:hypothetical protein
MTRAATVSNMKRTGDLPSAFPLFGFELSWYNNAILIPMCQLDESTY